MATGGAQKSKLLGRSGLVSSAPSSSGSGYVNIGTPEETALETYFVMLSKFNFDCAREQCDRERENKSGSGATNWCDFMAVLSRLAVAETSYFSLSFMERSWRLVRKEPLRATYEGILGELRKVHEVYLHRRGGTDLAWEKRMTELVSHIMEFAAAKRDMTEFYVRFDQADGCHLDYKKMDKYLKEMHERYRDSFPHSFLKPVKNTFLREVGVLTDLIHAQQHLSEWQFLPSLLTIQAAHNKLTIWNGVVPLGSQGEHVVRQSKAQKGRQSSPPPQAFLPYHYKWICKFHVALLAKFTFYFHSVLSEHATVYDMKHLSGKLDVDYISSLFSMIRQTTAICACLVFDSNGLSDFKGPKYHFPDSPTPVLTGLSSFPFMVAVPYDFDFHHHRANIVSTIIGRSHQLSSSPNPVSQPDEKLHCTYHLVQVDPRVTLVVISSARGRDRNSKTTSLLNEVATRLRNVHIAALLRPRDKT